jgi:hypothetical protein
MMGDRVCIGEVGNDCQLTFNVQLSPFKPMLETDIQPVQGDLW